MCGACTGGQHKVIPQRGNLRNINQTDIVRFLFIQNLYSGNRQFFRLHNLSPLHCYSLPVFPAASRSSRRLL